MRKPRQDEIVIRTGTLQNMVSQVYAMGWTLGFQTFADIISTVDGACIGCSSSIFSCAGQNLSWDYAQTLRFGAACRRDVECGRDEVLCRAVEHVCLVPGHGSGEHWYLIRQNDASRRARPLESYGVRGELSR